MGRNAPALTLQGPCDKFLSRVEELSNAQAPMLGTVLRYNERVASVFSYVAQVTDLPDPNSIASLEQRGIHKALKLPPNSMSRELMHSMEPFCLKAPLALTSLCRASMYRYARSAHEQEAFKFLGDDITMSAVSANRVQMEACPIPLFLRV